jgi:hypothetical protein
MRRYIFDISNFVTMDVEVYAGTTYEVGNYYIVTFPTVNNASAFDGDLPGSPEGWLFNCVDIIADNDDPIIFNA